MTALKIHTVHDADRTCQHCDGDTNLVHAEGFGLMHECEDCGDLSDPNWDLTFWNGARHTVIYRVRHNLFAWPDIATKNQLNELAQEVLEDPANAEMLRTMTGSVKPKVCALITKALPEPWEAHITTILP